MVAVGQRPEIAFPLPWARIQGTYGRRNIIHAPRWPTATTTIYGRLLSASMTLSTMNDMKMAFVQKGISIFTLQKRTQFPFSHAMAQKA